jgi:hypothetical protein
MWKTFLISTAILGAITVIGVLNKPETLWDNLLSSTIVLVTMFLLFNHSRKINAWFSKIMGVDYEEKCDHESCENLDECMYAELEEKESTSTESFINNFQSNQNSSNNTAQSVKNEILTPEEELLWQGLQNSVVSDEFDPPTNISDINPFKLFKKKGKQ